MMAAARKHLADYSKVQEDYKKFLSAQKERITHPYTPILASVPWNPVVDIDKLLKKYNNGPPKSKYGKKIACASETDPPFTLLLASEPAAVADPADGAAEDAAASTPPAEVVVVKAGDGDRGGGEEEGTSDEVKAGPEK